jgi:predicted aspartyl protease
LVLLCLLPIHPAAAQSSPTTHVVPFAFDEVTPNPVVKVSINGAAPLSFILDTGTAAALVIQPWVRDQLGLKPATDAAAGAIETDAVDSFALKGDNEDVHFNVTQAYVVDLGILDDVYGPHKIAGLIGVQLLATTATRFDFGAKTLTIYENADRFSIPGATTVPLTMNADGVATVKVTVAPGKSADLPIDTGGMFTGIPMSIAGALKPKAVITRHWSGQVSGMYMCPDFLLPTLNVGGESTKDVVVETLPESARCTIGLNILTGYSFIMDIPHGELTLIRRAGKFAKYGRGWTGIHFDPGALVWRVKDLERGSPAVAAGVRPGDEITDIDGYPLAGMTNAMVFHLLDGDAGAPARLSILRSGKTLTASFTRGDEFSAPKLPFDGLMLHKPDGQSIAVIGVQKGCAADVAGVHAGDTIGKIDGQPTAAMTVDQMHQAAVDRVIHLELTRPGSPKPLEIDLRAPSSSETRLRSTSSGRTAARKH